MDRVPAGSRGARLADGVPLGIERGDAWDLDATELSPAPRQAQHPTTPFRFRRRDPQPSCKGGLRSLNTHTPLTQQAAQNAKFRGRPSLGPRQT